MQLISLLPFLVGIATCFPLSPSSADVAAPFVENQLIRRQDNCTQYTSPSAGSVCIHRPYDCTATYLVQPDDTCTSIGNLYQNFTLSIFYYWNPDIGQTCFGLQAYVPVCIDTPWYSFVPPVQPPSGTVVSAKELPVPIMPSITTNCTSFELAGDGYTVNEIVQQNNITLNQFLGWNAYIDKNNPVAWAGYWVCVAA